MRSILKLLLKTPALEAPDHSPYWTWNNRIQQSGKPRELQLGKAASRLKYSNGRTWAVGLLVFSLTAISVDIFLMWHEHGSLGEIQLKLRHVVEAIGVVIGGLFGPASTEVTFNETYLQFRRRAFLSSVDKRINYSEFEGLRHRAETRTFGTGDEAVVKKTLQTIELVHKNPDVCIPLFSADDDDWNDREKLERYATYFDLPIIEEEGGQKFRTKEAFGKTISAAKSEGVTAEALGATTSQAALQIPPSSVTVSIVSSTQPQQLTIKLRFGGRLIYDLSKHLFRISLLCTPAFLYLYFVEEHGVFSVIAAFAVVVCIFALSVHLFRFLRAIRWPNQLRFSSGRKGHIQLVFRSTFGDTKNTYDLKNSEIEEISVAVIADRLGLKLRSGDRQMNIRTAMKKEDLEWVRDFLIFKL